MQQRRNRHGPVGFCLCPKCGAKKKHERGTPCQREKCPECEAKMIRENSYHHQLVKKKNK